MVFVVGSGDISSETKEIDLQFSLEDLETIEVIRKGSGGMVWDLESKCVSSTLQWESNITAFSAIYGNSCKELKQYIGDEYGFLSVLKFDAEKGKILQLPYPILTNHVARGIEVEEVDRCKKSKAYCNVIDNHGDGDAGKMERILNHHEALTNEIEEESQNLEELMRIKEILENCEDEIGIENQSGKKMYSKIGTEN
ncbi:hypothetical protein ACH5RR_008595 [Cinchona calisaya]|uniref:Uncharacterized protein n=1 Tax=Cinchona calisaya TaxID=153742 RepID=A0ABD3ACI0_9GENT